MDHVAIMRKSWGLTGKILSGEKTIESRWYMSKRAPWGRISAGDRIYFKNSGEPVRIMATAKRILTFEDMDEARVLSILKRYGRRDGIGETDTNRFFKMFKGKRYCILVFLDGARGIEPFEIRKDGFGAMSAWITLEDVRRIVRRKPKKPI
jgi:ASC-1-like (ASCH) protein